jgi:hypothetical protein
MTKDVVEKMVDKESKFGPKPKNLKKPEAQTFSINEKSPSVRIRGAFCIYSSLINSLK